MCQSTKPTSCLPFSIPTYLFAYNTYSSSQDKRCYGKLAATVLNYYQTGDRNLTQYHLTMPPVFLFLVEVHRKFIAFISIIIIRLFQDMKVVAHKVPKGENPFMCKAVYPLVRPRPCPRQCASSLIQ